MRQVIDDIINLSSFNDVFLKLFSKAEDTAMNIYNSLKATVEKTHAVLREELISKKTLAVALLVEIINVQEHAKQYLKLLDDMRKAREDLMIKASCIYEQFFEGVYDELDRYFEKKKRAMIKDILEHVSWYTGVADTARKAGGVVRKVVKGANQISKNAFNKELNLGEIDSRTYIEKLLDKHLAKGRVISDISKIFQRNAQRCMETWAREIKGIFPELADFDPTVLFESIKDIKPSFQVDGVQQVMLKGNFIKNT